jgi:hypothetical protein
MQDTAFTVGSLVEHPVNGRGIIIGVADMREDGMLWRIRWDAPVVWREGVNGDPPETYQSWWTDDEDLNLISEAK